MSYTREIYEESINRYARECAKIQEECMMDAICKGLDPHEIGLLVDHKFENMKIKFTCKAVKLYEPDKI